MSESPLVVTVPEAAQLLGVCRALGYDLVRRRVVPSVRLAVGSSLPAIDT